MARTRPSLDARRQGVSVPRPPRPGAVRLHRARVLGRRLARRGPLRRLLLALLLAALGAAGCEAVGPLVVLDRLLVRRHESRVIPRRVALRREGGAPRAIAFSGDGRGLLGRSGTAQPSSFVDTFWCPRSPRLRCHRSRTLAGLSLPPWAAPRCLPKEVGDSVMPLVVPCFSGCMHSRERESDASARSRHLSLTFARTGLRESAFCVHFFLCPVNISLKRASPLQPRKEWRVPNNRPRLVCAACACGGRRAGRTASRTTHFLLLLCEDIARLKRIIRVWATGRWVYR